MTTQTPKTQNGDTVYPPGTIVRDIVAQETGRVADPEAYPAESLGRSRHLVVPLTGSAPAWQAEPGALRPATADEIEAAR